ncbi:hypothetical protein [Halopenitus sp. POP-27]|uniref:hypothetical protein n=1 Tax=Halopenitus sp. POP-27 TaxID=2994425 RepID=UPI002468C5B9|nr:hypothetical protein [Halopenitus sp. POP-27]
MPLHLPIRSDNYLTFADLDSRIDNKTVSYSTIFDRICDLIPDYPVYIPLDNLKKYRSSSGWQRKENLIDEQEAKNHLSEGGNIGLILGKWFNGTTWVLFDVEREGILPEDLKAVIEPHTVISFHSPHGGHNRLVRIENKEAYNLLNSYKTTITSIRDNDEADLELITNGATPLPPSEISHIYCSGEKPCNGEGTDRYITASINPEAPPMGIDSIERIGDLLGLEGDTEPDYDSQDIGNVPSPRPKINIKEEYKENVPYVEHSFNDRLEYMKYGDWKGQELFIKLWNGNFEDIPGSNKQGKAECILANYIGFFFGNNENIVRLLMDMVPFETYYSKYDSHRKALIEYATSVDWCYCEGVSFSAKYETAYQIWINDSMTIEEIAERITVKEDPVYRSIKVLQAEGMIEKEGKIIKNKQITEGYLTKLYNVNSKYNSELEEGNV